jgi:acetyl-CoA carboxylase biotin carboxyl carrier protein
MDIKDIKQLVKLMSENDLTELNIEEGDTKIVLKRGFDGVPMVMAPSAAPVMAAPVAAVAAAAAPVNKDEGLLLIKSPMVGTFYSAPGPDSLPFISEGDRINDETVVCIVEAMKVMNEIKAECSGTIVEICVTNAQPVEFGQVLFKVKP